MRPPYTKPARAPAVADAPAAQTLCPQCRMLLADPTDLTRCPGCGYSQAPGPALAEAAAGAEQPVPAAPRRPSALGVSEFLQVAARMPDWLQSMVFGAVLIVVGCVAAHLILPDDCFGRALYTLLSVVLGLAAVIVGTVWASRMVPAAEVRGLSSNGRYSLPGLWRGACRRLPETTWPVNLTTWGLASIVSSLLIVGGLWWWVENVDLSNYTVLNQRKPDHDPKDPLTTFRPAPAKPPPLEQSVAECYVVGYQTDLSGDVKELVLVTAKDGKLVPAGAVAPDLPRERMDLLLARLQRLRVPQPPVAEVKGSAKWVKLGVVCEVYHNGAEEDGSLRDPRFKAIIR